MRSFRSFWLLAFLLLSPFAFLARVDKECTGEGKFVEFKLIKGEIGNVLCTLEIPDKDKLNFTVSIPDGCLVANNMLYFSYGTCKAWIERRTTSRFQAQGISDILGFDAISDVDFFLNQTHAHIAGKNSFNETESKNKTLSCKINVSQANPFLIDFTFGTTASLGCDVTVKFNSTNYKKQKRTTTVPPPPAKSSESPDIASGTIVFIVAGAIFGLVVIILLIVTVICCCCLRKRDRRTETSAAAENEAVLATCISTEEDQSVSVDKAQLHSVTCISKSNEKAKDGTANRRNRNLPPLSSNENQMNESADGKPEAYDVDKAVHGALGMHADFVEMRKEHENRKQKPRKDVKTERATTEKTAAIAPSMMQSLKLATLPSPKKKQKHDDLEGHLKPLPVPPKEKVKLDATQEPSAEKKA